GGIKGDGASPSLAQQPELRQQFGQSLRQQRLGGIGHRPAFQQQPDQRVERVFKRRRRFPARRRHDDLVQPLDASPLENGGLDIAGIGENLPQSRELLVRSEARLDHFRLRPQKSSGYQYLQRRCELIQRRVRKHDFLSDELFPKFAASLLSIALAQQVGHPRL